jgi:hypothetical protein
MERKKNQKNESNENECHESALVYRVQYLEERVNYLESLIMNIANMNTAENKTKPHDFDEIMTSIDVNHSHLDQILKTSMEEQIIAIIVEENKKRPFIKMMKDLCMFKTKWIRMDDSDLILLIRTIEHKVLLLHSSYQTDTEKSFDNTNIIYGLNLGRFKKIKAKIIEMINL